ncbi:hypothetical protein CcaverHIS002_0201950 [Cutaneotrichosporon cavernicola]|nr:hypothetical protein CcaverHIS002_0201950 [Cutaneotrichosporon cavernicola]
MLSRTATSLRTTSRAGRLVLRGLATSAPVYENKRTPLYQLNVDRGAKMVPFAGYDMPLSYGDVGQVAAHNHVRTGAGLFDVSHMVQHIFSGPGAQAFLSSLTPTSLDKIALNGSSLSVLLNDNGGIIDDLILTKHAEDGSKWYTVTNAGRADEDKAHFSAKLEAWNKEHPDQAVTWEILDGWGLVALQGPKAAEALSKLTDADLSALKFGQSMYAEIGKDKVRCHLARGGYTGEDGFEVSIPPESAVSITEQILAVPDAGMCLYGHDLNESISPIEGGLAWLVSKDRRTEGSFPGSSRILAELKDGPSRRRVGFEVPGAPAREGAKVFDEAGNEIGNGQHKKGTPVQIEIRKKLRPASIRPMPFVPPKYYK